MARPPMGIGTPGSISFSRVAQGWRARCRFRDLDGQTRSLERTGKTKGAAEVALKAAIRDRAFVINDSNLTRESTIAALLRQWWQFKRDTAALAVSTEASYADIIERIIIPGIGGMRLREATTGNMNGFLNSEARERLAQAELAQTILKQAFRYAATHDAVPSNPINDTLLPKRDKPKPRALTVDELQRMRSAVGSMRQNVWLADIVEVQLGVAGRIGEVLSLRLDDLDLDAPEGPRVHIQSTVISMAHRRPFRQDHTKDGVDGRRTVTVPDFAADVLRRRADTAKNSPSGFLFVSRNGTLLDPHNVRESWRNIRDRFDLGFVTPHHLRKTSLTMIAKIFDTQTASKFADHKDISTTTTYYIQQMKEAAPDVRRALNELAPKEADRQVTEADIEF